MLVLTRRANESIVIGDDIEVVVIEVRGDRVRLGIEAPRGSSVHRSEVMAAIHGAPVVAPPPIPAPPFTPPPPLSTIKRISG